MPELKLVKKCFKDVFLNVGWFLHPRWAAQKCSSLGFLAPFSNWDPAELLGGRRKTGKGEEEAEMWLQFLFLLSNCWSAITLLSRIPAAKKKRNWKENSPYMGCFEIVFPPCFITEQHFSEKEIRWEWLENSENSLRSPLPWPTHSIRQKKILKKLFEKKILFRGHAKNSGLPPRSKRAFLLPEKMPQC